MPGKQVTELEALPSFTDTSLLPVHNGAGLKKGLLSKLVEYLGTKFSNPNLLINPNFIINQRGKAEYTSNGYTVDRWSAYNVTVNRIQNGGVNLTFKSKGSFAQTLEKNVENVTLSIKVTQITGTVKLVCASKDIDINKPGVYSLSNNVDTSISQISLYNKTETSASMTVEWIKLEQGSIATTFIAPNVANELTKCKRYYNHIYFFHVFYSATSNFDYSFSHVIQSMRIKPTVKLAQSSSSGLSKYSASVNIGSGLTVITTATTNKVGNCNTGGIVELDAEIY